MPAPKKVKIRGIWYMSQAAAAVALDLSPETIRRAAKKGQAYLDQVGTNKAMGRHKPTKIRGMQFVSRQAAANHFGVTVSAIANADRRGTLDKVGARSCL